MLKLITSSIALVMLATAAHANTYETNIVVWTTGNVEGAGTDSNVYVKLIGTEGTSRRFRLQDFTNGTTGNDILEKGDRGLYYLRAKVGSAVLGVELESDGKHPGSDWHLDRIFTVSSEPDGKGNIAAFDLIKGRAPEIVGGTIVSTFIWEGWVTGEETFQEAQTGAQKRGIFLKRQEPVVKAVGAEKTQTMPIYVVYTADALDSDSPVPRVWDTTTTRSESLTLSDETSNSFGFGAEASFGYAAGDQGGAYGGITLSAEYSHLIAQMKSTEHATTSEVGTSDTFTAAPRTIQFRINSATGTVAQQTYRSLLQDKTFSGLYVRDSSPFVPAEVTLRSGVASDDVWNSSVAHAYAVAVGPVGYQSMVSRLKRANILVDPLPFEQALGR